MMIPGLGIIDSFGGYTAEYYNAFGFFVMRKTSDHFYFNFHLHNNSLGGFEPLLLAC